MDVKSTSIQAFSEMKTVSKDVETKISSDLPSIKITKGIEETKDLRSDFYSKVTLDKQVDSMNELLESNSTGLKFNVHEDLHRLYVQIIDKETDEVVKEIPPEKFLDMVATMLKHAGLIIDKRI